jgi:hypothetical protein
MWLRPARYQKSYWKEVIANRGDEETQNLLLNSVILAFIQTVDYDYWHRLKAWGGLERVRKQLLKLHRHRAADY